MRDGGATAKVLSQQIADTEKELAASGSADAKAVLKQLIVGRKAFDEAVNFILVNAKSDTKAVYAGSFAYLRLSGLVLGGWQMARALLAAERLRDSDPVFYNAKIATAHFFAENLLSQAQALATSIIEGGHSTNALEVEHF